MMSGTELVGCWPEGAADDNQATIRNIAFVETFRLLHPLSMWQAAFRNLAFMETVLPTCTAVYVASGTTAA